MVPPQQAGCENCGLRTTMRISGQAFALRLKKLPQADLACVGQMLRE